METSTVEDRARIAEEDYVSLARALEEKEKTLQEIYGSVSWNITIPVRIFGTSIRKLFGGSRWLSLSGFWIRSLTIGILKSLSFCKREESVYIREPGNGPWASGVDIHPGFQGAAFQRILELAKKFARMTPGPVRSALRQSYYGLVCNVFPGSSTAQAWQDFQRGSQLQSSRAEILFDSEKEGSCDSSSTLCEIVPIGERGIDIFVFPIIDWNFRIQRPQHISEGLGQKGYRVFYLSTIFSNSDNPGFKIIESPCPNVYICQVSCPDPHPVIYSGQFNPGQADWVCDAFDCFLKSLGNNPSVAVVQFPFWVSVLRRFGKLNIIYDCIDFHEGFSNIGKSLPEMERELLSIADSVTTTSERLSSHLENFSSNVVIRNAADFDFFSVRPEKVLSRTDRPVVGYIGAISEWFDSDLICQAASENPEWDFVLVGSYAHADVGKLMKCENVRLLGEAPYSLLTYHLYAFDVCVIPFRLNRLIEHTDPVKLYEYLSAGKPVVATNLPELAGLDSSLVHVAQTGEEFLQRLREAMLEKDDAEKSRLRQRWASGQTWQSRVDDFDKVIQSCYPKVSVIVLCHNNLAFTRSCVYSLERFTSYPNWELIVVDNASVDGTDEFLEQFSQDRQWVKVVTSPENIGFSAGNNLGVRFSCGEYLVLLNNDTYVTDGWLNKLIRPLRQNHSLGLVGPVTNAIGNEAKIDVHYSDMAEMANVAKRYTEKRDRQIFYCDNLAFFCVALQRSVFDEIGELDEAFNIGFFEDDDYCMRVRQAGYSIGIAEDVFVHHRLSATLDTLGAIAKKKQFDANLEIFESKWGKWTPHRHRNSA